MGDVTFYSETIEFSQVNKVNGSVVKSFVVHSSGIENSTLRGLGLTRNCHSICKHFCVLKEHNE